MNQAPQPYSVDHTGTDGLMTDRPISKTPADALTAAQNMHLLGAESQGEQAILQTASGNSYVAGMPAGWVVMGSATYQSVCYYLLAEVESGVATGRGQIGSFPAPQPADNGNPNTPSPDEGVLVPRYRPFQNYQPYAANGDLQQYQFVDERFNFDLQHPCEVEIQPAYDGTVNVIFNDAKNPPRLINSRFTVLEGERYKIIDREGERDSNLYRPEDFGNSIRLFQRDLAITTAELVDVASGGSLLGGTWTYYFRGVTQDLQQSDVLAWTNPIPVFDGDSVTNVVGRTGATGQRVSIQLRNISRNYQFIRATAVHASGNDGAEVINTVELPDQRLSGTSLLFSHTGYEPTKPGEIDSISVRNGRIDTFRTMTQVENRLAFAGTREAIYDTDQLGDFARLIKLGHREAELALAGGVEETNTVGDITQPFSRNQQAGIGWLGGYANPRNCADRLGYWRGETYPFGLVFMLKDGTETAVFPCRGIDAIFDNAPIYNMLPTDEAGWAVLAGENVNGVYRFPRLRTQNASPLLPRNRQAVNIMGATLEFPDIPADVRLNTVGFYVVRGKRVKDCIVQGYAINTITSLLVAPNGNQFDHHDSAFNAIYATNSTAGANLKVLPALFGMVETAVKKPDRSESQGRKVGPIPFFFTKRTQNTKTIIQGTRYAFYSPDTIANPAAFTGPLTGRALRFCREGDVFFREAVPYVNQFDNNPNSPTLYKTIYQQSPTYADEPRVRAFWTNGGDPGINEGQFGSMEKHLRGKHTNADKYLVQSLWDDYVGIKADADLDFLNVLHDNGMSGTGSHQGSGFEGGGTSLSSLPRHGAWIVNLYPDNGTSTEGGARLREVLKDLYKPENIVYFPITQKITWEELGTLLDAERKLVVWGGDTYVGQTYRRINRNLSEDQALDKAFAAAEVGQAFSLVCESDVNPYVRSPELQARPGEGAARSYLPYSVANVNNGFVAMRQAIYRVPETRFYNQGYSRSEGYSQELALPINVPFRAREFDTRVAVTSAHSPESFQNGYRTYLPGTAQDYARNLGAIVQIKALGSSLYIGQERGVIVVGVNERTQTSAEAGKSAFLDVQQVLSPYPTVVSAIYGLQHRGAMLVTDNQVYGVDAHNGVWWQVQGGQMNVISHLQVGKLLKPYLDRVKGYGQHLLQRQLQLHFDAGKNDVLLTCLVNRYAPVAAAQGIPRDPYLSPSLNANLFSFLADNITVPPTAPGLPAQELSGQVQFRTEESLVLAYNEELQRFVSTYSYFPQHLFNIGKTLYSIPMPDSTQRMRHGIYKHGQNYGRFYERMYESYFEFVVLGSSRKVQKIVNTLVVSSNEFQPTRIVLTAEKSPELTLTMVNGRISKRNIEYVEGNYYVTVGTVAVNPKHRVRVRGKWCRVRVYYAGTMKRLLLENVQVGLTDSFAK